MSYLTRAVTGIWHQSTAPLDVSLYAKSIGSNHSAGDRCDACNQPRSTLYAYDLPVKARKPTFRPAEPGRVCIACMAELNREKAREEGRKAKRAGRRREV